VTVENREITLGLLSAIHNNSNVTQRSVAKELDVALGLANAYLKRCIKKGLIKVQQAPANRYAYYLTPQGFVEKAKLTSEYLTQGFQFFRQARNQCSEIFEVCEENGWNRAALHGLTDIAEIAVLCAANNYIEIIGIVDKSSELKDYGGAPIVQDFSELAELDVLVITDLGDPQSSYDAMTELLPSERVLAPAILNVTLHDKSFGKTN